jgi:stearoyl-CoA desaturase (Delta-9 desaturase)
MPAGADVSSSARAASSRMYDDRPRGEAVPRSTTERYAWLSAVPFFLVHLLPFAAFFTGVTLKAVVLAIVLYIVRMFLVTGVYHRYFSHRSYRLSRPAQFVLGFAATTAVQKGPLWWSACHRDHHRFSDTDRDPHSPKDGFLWSHVGWILSYRYKETKFENVGDLARFPELRLLDRFDVVGPIVLGTACFLYAGLPGLFIGFFASTVVLWHATFSINSLAHVFGRRRYDTPDTSRNSYLLAFITLGEGWHNNHHFRPRNVRSGLNWREPDFTYWVIRAWSWLGLARDLKRPVAVTVPPRPRVPDRSAA